MKNEFMTGVIVAAALAVAAFFWVKTTDFSSKPYRLKTYFNYAEGVKVDSVVKLSGIEAGRVEKISFRYEPETKVELSLVVNKDAKVREDSVAFISTSGIVGDAYIGITAGSAGKPFTRDGATLESEDPIEARKLMKRADAIADKLDMALAQVKTLAEGVNGVVKDNKARIDSIAANLEETSSNFRELSEDIKKHPWKLLMKK